MSSNVTGKLKASRPSIPVNSQATPSGHINSAAKTSVAYRVHAVQLPEAFLAEDLFRDEATLACEGEEEEAPRLEGSPDAPTEEERHPPRKKARVGNLPLTPLERKAKKKRRRDATSERKWNQVGHQPTRNAKQKYVGGSQSWTTRCLVEILPVKAGGYSAISKGIHNLPQIKSVEHARALGFSIVECDGTADRPIIDSKGRVLAVVAPPPDDPTYQGCVERALATMLSEGGRADFDAGSLSHKRGEGFAAINVGISYGNGHTKPSRLNTGRFNKLEVALLADEGIQRLASFQDAIYAMWHPKAYHYYKEELGKLREAHPELHLPLFTRSIMPTVAFNIGTSVCTKNHIDPQNCPFGWCIVTALGSFNSKRGGHIILWELGVVLEFPAGACVCLPSAVITHSNIPVAEGDIRASFTQYCSGEIFRYVENGFVTDKALKVSDPLLLAINQEKRKARLQHGYNMLSTISDLI